LYLAQHGTGADAPASRGVASGREVVFIALTAKPEGGYSGRWQPFARFNEAEKAEGGARFGYRPIDVTVGPEGALYIAEWTTGAIFRVTYEGGAAQGEGEFFSDGDPDEPPASEPERDLLAEGEMLFYGQMGSVPACSTCHALGNAQPGAQGVGPSLAGLAGAAASRVPGLSAEAYIRQSISAPNAYIVPGYPAGLMYANYGEYLTDEQITALVAYVLAVGR
jgi:mono/diheme cytochrome c family protein